MSSLRFQGLVSFSVILVLAGCAPAAPKLSPRGDQIRLTRNAADVAACAGAGSVDARPYIFDPETAETQIRNAAVGLRADTVLITYDPFVDYGVTPPKQQNYTSGFAYRCPKAP